MSTEFSRFNFSGGEVHVKQALPKGPYTDAYELRADLRSSDDIMALLLTTDALRRSGRGEISLVMPYIPYARQDRVMVPGEPLSIKVFCDLINTQNYKSVTVWDPHSDVATALLDRAKVVTQADILAANSKVVGGSDNILVCPDAGARKKIYEVAKALGSEKIIYADKIRDVSTGKITGTTLNLDQVLTYSDKDFLIVDDCIDGGYTFTELAKLLRPLTSGKIKLYATHGIFSKGLSVFDGLIDEVYTANSWINPEDNTSKTKLVIVNV